MKCNLKEVRDLWQKEISKYLKDDANGEKNKEKVLKKLTKLVEKIYESEGAPGKFILLTSNDVILDEESKKIFIEIKELLKHKP